MVPAPMIEAVVMGASAGGIEALDEILRPLPPLRIPLVVVVHLPPRDESLLVELFAPRCASPVREACDKQGITPGIWFAPADYHLLIEGDRCFALSIDEPVRFSRPSIDVLFESAADAYGPALAGVVLTGASDDGAAGALAVRRSGGVVLVQDPKTAAARVMPESAAAVADPQFIGSLSEIATKLTSLVEGSIH